MNSNANRNTLVGKVPYIILKHGTHIEQFPLVEDHYYLGRDPNWSTLVVPNEIQWSAISRQHGILRREGKDYRIFDGDETGKLSSNGILLNHRKIPTTGHLLSGQMKLEIGQDPTNQVILQYISPSEGSQHNLNSSNLDLKKIQNFPVVLGRSQDTNGTYLQLNAPIVSRHHAKIERNNQGQYIIKDCNSVNGTFVNSSRITKPILLSETDIIRIGPFTLIFRNEVLELFDQGNKIRIDAYNLVHHVTDKDGRKTILDNVSFPIEPGQLVALVGGSGTGKSTLLKTLLGISKPTKGVVCLNGEDIQAYFNIYRTQIGYVPQEDIIHHNLTVEEVLTYACRLRLPADANVEQVISKVLDQVRLNDCRDKLVQALSGGQRKRVSIAVELLADPSLFFLDEPTSGLDPGLDKEIMHLLRQLADSGKTVILVTHATSNINICDRIAFMGKGGRLCYFGPPQEAIEFFGLCPDNNSFADIYIQLNSGNASDSAIKKVIDWQHKFAASSAYKVYLASALVQPSQAPFRTIVTSAKGGQASLTQQFNLLCQRYWQLVWRDRFNLFLSLVTAPIGILLIILALSTKTPFARLDPIDATQAPLALRVLFVFTCAALWVGLSSTVQECVKEISIYTRERLVNLGLLPYLLSKLTIWKGLAIIQTVLIVAVILIGFDAPESKLLSWWLGLSITTFLTLLTSLNLGIMISAFAHNESQASSILPLVLLPQIIFSGILFKLEGFSTYIAWTMLSRWSVAAFGALVDVNAMVPPPDPNITTPLPFETSPVYEATWHNLLICWGVLILHSIIYFFIALYCQKQKDIIGNKLRLRFSLRKQKKQQRRVL